MTGTTLEQDLAPALEAFAAATDAHGHDYMAGHGCRCGFEGNRRSVGQHVRAMERRAEKEYRIAADAIIEARLAR